MKKLNRKGFTLVELLAVIVILAIVVGITLVTVLPSLDKSKSKAFETAVETIRDYIQNQRELASLGSTFQGEDYNEDVGTESCPTTNPCSGTVGNLLEVTGYADNIATLKWSVTNGIVKIECATAKGDYLQGSVVKKCS